MPSQTFEAVRLVVARMISGFSQGVDKGARGKMRPTPIVAGRLAFVVLLLLIGITVPALAQVHVRGYFRGNGTYVQPHWRSAPDGNPYNNWSFPGNVNPYTGKVAPGNPSTYLEHYYSRGTYSGPPASVPNGEAWVPTNPASHIVTPAFPNGSVESLFSSPSQDEVHKRPAPPSSNDQALRSLFE